MLMEKTYLKTNYTCLALLAGGFFMFFAHARGLAQSQRLVVSSGSSEEIHLGEGETFELKDHDNTYSVASGDLNLSERPMQVETDASLTLSREDSAGKFHITNNHVSGVAGVTGSTATRSDANAKASGGIFHNQGESTIDGAVFSDNSFSMTGGSATNTGAKSGQYAYAASYALAEIGGGIVSNAGGTLRLTNSEISGNTISAKGGNATSVGTTANRNTYANAHGNAVIRGGALYNASGTLEMSDVVFANNIATATGGSGKATPGTPGNGYFAATDANGNATVLGGAFYNDYGTATLSNVTFSDNAALAIGGTATITSGTGTTSAKGTASGGAVYASGYDYLTLTDTLFVGNTATAIAANDTALGQGGAIYLSMYSSLALEASAGVSLTHVGNYATGGSGSYASDVNATTAQADAGGFLYMGNGASATINTEAGSTITIGASDAANRAHDTIASQDSGATLSKTGSGTLVLNADNRHFLGTTNVTGGILSLGNREAMLGGAVTASSGGALSGIGTFTGAGATIGAGGILSPGLPGTPLSSGFNALTFDGDVHLEAGSVFVITIADADTWTGIEVNGTFFAENASLNLIMEDGYTVALDDSFRIVAFDSEDALVSGTTFSYGMVSDLVDGSIFDAGLGDGYGFRLDYKADGIYLTAVPAAVPEPATWVALASLFILAFSVWRRRF